jgi:polyhydroxybutyrate depolymerase
MKVTTKWVAGKLGDPARMPLCSEADLALLPAELRAVVDHPLKDDVAFVRTMLDFLAANYSVDSRRIYASGFSNGGAMTSRLALDLSDRFAALAAAAGLLSLPPQAARALSFAFTVGNEDDRFTAPLGLAALPMADTLFIQLPMVKAQAVDPMLQTLQLDDPYVYEGRAMFGVDTSQFTWSASRPATANTYRILVIEGLGHQYPNGTNHPFVAADFLWEFFRTQSLP